MRFNTRPGKTHGNLRGLLALFILMAAPASGQEANKWKECIVLSVAETNVTVPDQDCGGKTGRACAAIGLSKAARGLLNITQRSKIVLVRARVDGGQRKEFLVRYPMTEGSGISYPYIIDSLRQNHCEKANLET